MLIMCFTELNMVNKSMTGKKYDGFRLHQDVKCYLLPNMFLILEGGIQYRFPENLVVIARRWLDVKLIKKDKEMGV